MKLAEALSLRKDLQMRIEQLKERVLHNVKVQEGERPMEDPDALMKEMELCLTQLQDYIWRINATNMQVRNAQGRTLTQMIAERDALSLRIGAWRSIFKSASEGASRYSRSEIKTLTVIDVKALGKRIDDASAQLRKLDIEIQSLNFTYDLI